MLSKAAEQCTEYLIKYNKITEQQKSIYKYGFELLVSTAVCIGAILVCGILGGIREGGNHIFIVFYSDTNHCRRLSCRLLWEMLYNDKCDSGRMHHDSGMDALYWE